MFIKTVMPRILRSPEGDTTGGSGTPSGAPAATGAPAGSPPPAFTPVAAPWTGKNEVYKIGEGETAKPWWESVPEAPVRELMNTKQYKNPAELAVAYHNLNKLQNNAGDVLALPKVDAPKEAWDAFYTKLGRPESQDKYDLKMPDGVTPDENFMKLGKELFFELGADNKKAQGAMDKWNKFVVAQESARVEKERVENDTALAGLATKWGAQLEENKAAGKRVVDAVGLSNELIAKIEGQIGSAAIVELLAAIGSKSKEGGFVGSNNNNSDPNDPSTMSKEQASARITALQGDVDFQKKYTDVKHPEHQQAVKTMEGLFAKVG